MFKYLYSQHMPFVSLIQFKAIISVLILAGSNLNIIEWNNSLRFTISSIIKII